MLEHGWLIKSYKNFGHVYLSMFQSQTNYFDKKGSTLLIYYYVA